MNILEDLNLLLFLDVNECETLNGGCQHQCVNKNGSYVCECNEKYVMDGNGKTCSGKLKIRMSCDTYFKCARKKLVNVICCLICDSKIHR